MPARPPETQFYDNQENYTLWRDVSRLFEDWAPVDAEDRTERFITILQDVINRLRSDGIEESLDAASSNG